MPPPPNKDLVAKVANIPLARPGFVALGMTAPVMVKVNPDGKWESSAPTNIDEEQLKKIVDHLMKTNAITAAQSYCSQCCAENKNSGGGKANAFVPIIMMPILPADQCPFDMDCEVKKIEAEELKQKKKPKKVVEEAGKSKGNTKQKKRVFFMQRLTDFDLLSQW